MCVAVNGNSISIVLRPIIIQFSNGGSNVTGYYYYCFYIIVLSLPHFFFSCSRQSHLLFEGK